MARINLLWCSTGHRFSRWSYEYIDSKDENQMISRYRSTYLSQMSVVRETVALFGCIDEKSDLCTLLRRLLSPMSSATVTAVWHYTMRYLLGAALHSLSFILVLAIKVSTANAWSPPSFKTRSDAIILPIRSDTTNSRRSELSIRSPADNTTFGAGLAGVTLSGNKQYVSPLRFLELTVARILQILLCRYQNG